RTPTKRLSSRNSAAGMMPTNARLFCASGKGAGTPRSWWMASSPAVSGCGRVWHCRLQHELMSNATLYAYQVAGPLLGGWFERHAFDDSKVLLDPYAREIFFPPTMDRMAASRPGSNAGRAPLGLIPKDVSEERTSRLRNLHECDTIIYELHVGGFTGPYADFTGTGNTLHCANQAVRKMIMDSIRHWSLHMGVDGVDLTSVFTRAMDAR